MKKLALALLAFVLPLTDSGASDATSVIQFSFDALCKTSVRIAHVTCISSEPFLAEDGVRTQTRFRVVEGVKGEVGQEIEIALPGGQVDGQHVAVAGMPTFVPGQETVLFLSGPDGSGSPWPVGLGQGCYRVTRNGTPDSQVHLRSGSTPIPEGAAFKPTLSGSRLVDLKVFLDKVRETVTVSPADEK